MSIINDLSTLSEAQLRAKQERLRTNWENATRYPDWQRMRANIDKQMEGVAVELNKREDARLSTLRAEHAEYMASWVAQGKPSRMYLTPCCRKPQTTTAPSDEGDTWDSLTTCQWCGETHYKIVTTTSVTAKAV